jgi:hypothetical protein
MKFSRNRDEIIPDSQHCLDVQMMNAEPGFLKAEPGSF